MVGDVNSFTIIELNQNMLRFLGECKEDMTCSTSVKVHNKSPPPYHAAFSEPVRGIRPDISEIAADEMARELAKLTNYHWDGEPHRGGEVTSSGTWMPIPSAQVDESFPSRSRSAFRIPAYYKKSHPYAMSKNVLHSSGTDTKRSLLRQFKDLSRHYNSMRRLISEGLGVNDDNNGDVTTRQERNASTDKRKANIYDDDTTLRLGMLGTEKEQPFNFMSGHPWAARGYYDE